MRAASSPSITANRALGRHALQIEINRAIYMEERTLERKPAFSTLAADLKEAFRQVMDDLGGEVTPHSIAAE